MKTASDQISKKKIYIHIQFEETADFNRQFGGLKNLSNLPILSNLVILEICFVWHRSGASITTLNCNNNGDSIQPHRNNQISIIDNLHNEEVRD